MKKKRSGCIHLLLIGAAGVMTAGCDDSVRYLYENRNDCVTEWSEEDCNSVAEDGYSGSSDFHYAIGKSNSRSRKAHTKAISVNKASRAASAWSFSNRSSSSRSYSSRRGGFGSHASSRSSGG